MGWGWVAAVGIRYGKFCGVGWSGCEGEEPCDDLDACCRDHDHCVDKKGKLHGSVASTPSGCSTLHQVAMGHTTLPPNDERHPPYH
ncbi:putative phospholipase A2-1-like protein [Hordeum vulgare]|nr:putative phospholipase A2-1-like protein [Hordeum vulgare]